MRTDVPPVKSDNLFLMNVFPQHELNMIVLLMSGKGMDDLLGEKRDA